MNKTAYQIYIEYKTNYEIMCAVYTKLNAKHANADFTKVIDRLCQWHDLMCLWEDIVVSGTGV